LYRARRFEEAISHLNRAIALEPRSYGGYLRLADAYEEIGRYTEALALHNKAEALSNRQPACSLRVARIYARMGKHEDARQILDRLVRTGKHDSLTGSYSTLLAGLYAALGDRDEAFRVLFKNVEFRDGLGVYAKVDPPLDALIQIHGGRYCSAA
jgi:tetratricopeptide (TPR) repeat protein